MLIIQAIFYPLSEAKSRWMVRRLQFLDQLDSKRLHIEVILRNRRFRYSFRHILRYRRQCPVKFHIIFESRVANTYMTFVPVVDLPLSSLNRSTTIQQDGHELGSCNQFPEVSYKVYVFKVFYYFHNKRVTIENSWSGVKMFGSITTISNKVLHEQISPVYRPQNHTNLFVNALCSLSRNFRIERSSG